MLPLHHRTTDSRHFLRFVFRARVFQFKALCFGLSTAPQVFTRVMAPVSAMLHSMGICMRRYLDDWLVQSSSQASLLRDLQTVLQLCHELGIVVNPQKSNLVPSQVVQYLGVVIDAKTFRASPSQERISKLLSTAAEFQSSASPPASLWLLLLGVLSLLAHLVPGGRLRMRSLQICLHRSWDRQDLEASVSASVECLRDLQWWLHLPRLSLGVSLCQVSPDLHFWSDASDVGWGAHLDRQIASGLWDSQQAALSINARELLAIKLGLLQFVISTRSHSGCLLRQHFSCGLSPQGGRHQVTFPQHLGSGDPALVGVTVHPSGSAVPTGLQQRPGGRFVSSSPAPSFRVVPKRDRLSIFMPTVAGLNRFICDLSKSSLFDILLTIPGSPVSRHRRVSPVLEWSPGVLVPSGGHHSASPREAPGLQGDGAHPCGSALAPVPLVLRPAPALAGPSSNSAGPSRPPALASVSSSLPGSPSAQASCLETLQRFTRTAGFSSAVAEQSSLARRHSSRAVYQVRWSIYRSWCRERGHSVSRPTLAKVADFLYWLRFTRGLSVSSLRGYPSVLSAVFRFHLPSLSSDQVIRDLFRSFRLSSGERVLRPPAWDLSKVLWYLVSPVFEPLSQAPFRALTLKTLFLLALATAKRVGELQALSSIVTFVGGDACLSYIPQFVAKSESLTRPIPRSFLVKSLADFAAGLDIDLLLCPVRALRLYLLWTRSLSPLRHRLFVSPRRPSRAMSKNAVSFLLMRLFSYYRRDNPFQGLKEAYPWCL